MKKSSLSKVGIILICLLTLIFTFLLGQLHSEKNIINQAKANEITSIPDNMNITSWGVRYEKVYAYGHTFIIFSSASGDIEVLVEN